MFEKKKIGKWNALIHYDKTENVYSIFWKGKGGAIISDENREVAEQKWLLGMQLATAIKNTRLYATAYNKLK